MMRSISSLSRKFRLGALAVVLAALSFLAAQPASAVIIDFGSSPAGPITNSIGASGDFAGTEYGTLGVLFDAGPGDILNIGCAAGAGNPDNCLGADDVSPDDFSGIVLVSFDLSGVTQTTDLIILDFVNNASRTIIRDIMGNILLDQLSGDVNFASLGIASIEWQLSFDGVGTFEFGNLQPAAAPEPSALLLLGAGLAGLAFVRRKRS